MTIDYYDIKMQYHYATTQDSVEILQIESNLNVSNL